MRKAALRFVEEIARRDDRVWFVGSDLGAGTLDGFRRDMPDRFLMEGISEQAVVGLAAGLALEGRIVYVNTIAAFLVRRAFEQIVLDLCLHRARVRLLGSGGGLVYGPLGPTHEAVEELALLRALPGMTVVAPADAGEMRAALAALHEHAGPVYFRFGRGGDPQVTDPARPFLPGRAVPLRAGGDALVVVTGTLAQTALDAADLLSAEGIGVAVLHMPCIKPFDVESLRAAAARARAVVSLEEHLPAGGLGGAVAECLAEADLPRPPRFRRLALPDRFPDRYGSQGPLLALAGLTPERVAATLRDLLAAPRGGGAA